MDADRDRFVDAVLRNDINRVILDRAPELCLPDWYLTAGAVFQTVWNVIDDRPPGSGISDYDLFYFDATDLSWDAEDAVIRRAAVLFADLGVPVEVRNEARVHLWYEDHFGTPGVEFTSTSDAIDHFASTTCCYAVRRESDGDLTAYAPHGYTDLLAMHVRPNPVIAKQDVYDQKTKRWLTEWPGLSEPWPSEQSAQ